MSALAATPVTRIATRLIFFIAGFGMSAWAPLVPLARERASLDEEGLGLLLLCAGIGSMAAMAPGGVLAARFGCRRVLLTGALMVCASLPCLAGAISPSHLAIALFIFGMGLGLICCTSNLQAVIVERAHGRPMMSGFHGLFSVGGFSGAAAVSALLALGLPPVGATFIVVATIALTLALAWQGILTERARGGPIFVMPRGIVLALGVLCFVVFLTEGAMLDWSALFLTSVHAMPESWGGLGYATFSFAMTIGRLTGDAVIHRFGPVRVVNLGGLIAASGQLLSVYAPSWPIALIGCALVGAGCASIVPIMYSAAGRQTVMPAHLAVAAVTTMGCAGVLVGPAAIGFIAHATSLSVVLTLLAVLMIMVAASARVIPPKKRGS
jgi:MFS family permease